MQINPAILEFARGVVAQSCHRAVFVGGHEQTGLEDGLEAIANAQDELFLVAEDAELLAQKDTELVGEDLAGGHVVAVGEAAGNDQDLVIVKQGGLIAEAVNVQAVGLGTGVWLVRRR